MKTKTLIRNPFFTFFCLLVSLVSIVSKAQELVKDVNANGASLVDATNNYSQQCFTCGSYVYFLVNDSAGNELWKTDGTTAGTTRVVDLYPGPTDGIPAYESLKCLNGELYFRGSDPASIATVWKTDGTATGTKKAANVFADPGSLIIFQNKIIFVSVGNELWVTEGTPQTTVMLKKIDYGIGTTTHVHQISSGASVYFFMSVYNNFVGERYELWKSDGTVNGTTLVKTFPFVQNYFPYGLTQIQDKVFFHANDNVSGDELWISDGTSAGTKMVVDLNPGAGSANVFIKGVYDNKLIFTIPGDTWISDGTAAGTNIMIPNFYMSTFSEYSGALYAIGQSSFSPFNYSLYKTNGTSSGSEKMSSLGTDLSYLEKIPLANNKLVFPFQDASHGVELGVSSGGLNDAALLKDINPGTPGSLLRSAAELANQVIFIADDGAHGFELWKTDGTSAGTVLLKDVKPGTGSANIESMTLLNNQLFFLAGQNTSHRSLWKSDGTSSGTELFKEFSSPAVLGKVDDYMIILDNTKFWKTNGTPEGTSLMWDFSSKYSGWGYGSYPSSAAGDILYFYFSAGDFQSETWTANIKTNEIKPLKNIYPGPQSSVVDSPGGVIGDLLIFPARDPVNGEEVWITNGTESGTKLLKDIRSGGSSNPRSFVSTGDKVFFTADDGAHGLQLWSTNGTPEGTLMVTDVAGTLTGVSPVTPARLQNKVIFSGVSGGSYQPWISDGTPAGTRILKKFTAAAGPTPSNFVSINDKVYFAADDGVHGMELAVTDGTEPGTSVIDVIAGPISSFPTKITKVDEAVYFYANNKIWTTSGTTASTEMVAEINLLSDLYHTGNYVCFVAQHPELGSELYRVDVKILPVTGIENFAQSIDIFPNPAVSEIYTHSPANTGFQIIDQTGRVVNEKISIIADEAYNVSEIPRGSYFMNIRSNGKSAIYRFIKE